MERGISRPSPATRLNTKTGTVPCMESVRPGSACMTDSGHSLMEKSSSSP